MTDDDAPDVARSDRPSDPDDPLATDPDDPLGTDPDDPLATDHMTDTDADTTDPDEPPTTAETTDEPTDSDQPIDGDQPTDDDDDGRSTDGGIDRLSTGRLREVLDRVGLAALVLLALVAGWGFYSQTGAAIRTWLDPAYQPIALAAFNLAILFVALAGVTHQLSRIRTNE